MKAKPHSQNVTPQMHVSAMPSTRMLTDSRERANPASSNTKPTCMPNTRNAAISVHIVLMALMLAIGSRAGAGFASCAPSIAGRNHRVINVSPMDRPMAFPRKRNPMWRRIRGSCQFVRNRAPTVCNLVITASPPCKGIDTELGVSSVLSLFRPAPGLSRPTAASASGLLQLSPG
jgi:hypothetical protein